MEICYSSHSHVDKERLETFCCDEWHLRDSKQLENDCTGISLQVKNKYKCQGLNW